MQVKQYINQSEAICKTLMTFEYEDWFILIIVGNEYELVLNLVIGIAYALLFGKEVRQLLLIVNAVLNLAELGEFVFELFGIHFLVVVLAHNFD